MTRRRGIACNPYARCVSAQAASQVWQPIQSAGSAITKRFTSRSITLTTLLFGELLGGAVLTEQVFTIPGFGKMIVDSVFNRDYAVVQGVVLVVAIGFLALNLLADVLYVLINPKMRSE